MLITILSESVNIKDGKAWYGEYLLASILYQAEESEESAKYARPAVAWSNLTPAHTINKQS